MDEQPDERPEDEVAILDGAEYRKWQALAVMQQRAENWRAEQQAIREAQAAGFRP